MLVFNPSVLNKVVKTMTPQKERVEEAQIRGTIVFSANEHFVRLDGASGDSLTPIANFAEGASDAGFVHGDRVLVLIKNHQAIVTKNLTTGLQAQAAKEAGSFVTVITDEGITAQRIIANDTFTNTLRANEITADEIIAGMATIDTLDTNYAHITEGVIDNAKIGVADINDLSANYAHITQGVIDNAKIGYADVNNLNAHYAAIDIANVNNAWIENGAIRKAEVFDENVFDLSGNRATLSRIDASKINVANLRADNLVVRRINGQPVVGGYTLIDSNSSGYASKNPQALGWYEFVNAQWVLSTDMTVDMTKAYYQEGNEVSLYDQEYIDNLENGLQQQIDGAVETYTGTVVPTLVNWPYTDWYDTSVTPVHDERAKHVGDIYYVVNSASDENGYCYRFAYDNTQHAYDWVLIKDSDVTKALSDISDLQTFESETTSWIEETDEGLETIRTNYTALSGRVDDVEDTANAALPTSTFETFESTTFTDLVDEVDEQSTTMTNMTSRLGLNSDGTGASTDIVAKESALEQTVDGISTRVGKTETKLAGMYATSSTAEGTRDKVATITPALPNDAVWELSTGTMVTVKFVNANTYEATSSNPLRLNVNGKGLKPIKTYANGNLSEAEYKWAAGSTFTFVYNGTNWLMQDSSVSMRMNSAETLINQTANNVLIKATETDTTAAQGGQHLIQSLINVAPSGVTISADKVNIDGAAIFTGSGRLSTTSLGNTYDAKGAASTAESNAKGYADGLADDLQDAIDAKKSVHTLMSGNTSGASYSTILNNYAKEGTSVNYTISSSTPTTGIKIGDTVRLGYYVSDMGTAENRPVAYIVGTVTDVNSATNLTMIGHGLDTTIIDGGNILTNSIGANQIAANSIGAMHMTLSDSTNLATVNEQYFASLPTDFSTDYQAAISGGYLTKKVATQTYLMLTDYTPNSFKQNDELYYEFYGKAATAGTITLGAWGYTGTPPTHTYSHTNQVNISLTTTEAFYSGTIKLANANWANATTYLLGFSDAKDTKSQIYVKKVVIRRKNGGELIVDGAITVGSLSDSTKENVLNSNILIGGTNLFGYGSECASLNGFTTSGTWDIATEDGFTCAHASGALNTTKYLCSKIPFTPKPLETMTYSCYVKIKNIAYGTTNPMCELYFGGQTIDGTWRAWTTLAIYVDGVKYEGSISTLRFPTYITDTKWHHFAVVARAYDANFTDNLHPYVYLRDATGDLYVRNIKYERGNKYTDWTPAPEDLESAYYGSCETAAATAAKVVTCDGFTLKVGTIIGVRFANGNTCTTAITLNVNGTGAKTVLLSGSNTGTADRYNLNLTAYATVSFVYDGTYWRTIGIDQTSTMITRIDNTGISIHPNGTSDHRAEITSNGMNIYKGGVSVAQYGDTARIGKADSGHATIASDGLHIWKNVEPTSTNEIGKFTSAEMVLTNTSGNYITDTKVFSSSNLAYLTTSARTNYALGGFIIKNTAGSDDIDTVLALSPAYSDVSSIASSTEMMLSVSASNGLKLVAAGNDKFVVSNTGKVTVEGHSSAIGDYKTATGTSKSLTAGTAATLCTLALTAGVWVVMAQVRFPNASDSTYRLMTIKGGTASTDNPAIEVAALNGYPTNLTASEIFSVGSSGTTIYLNVQAGKACTIAAGSVGNYNYMKAVRIA